MNVYDFDDTIYDGESCLDLFGFYIKKNPKLLLHLPGVLLGFVKYKRGKITVDAMMNKYASEVGGFFASQPNLEADMVEFWDTHMHKIRPFYKKVQREDDLIITGSPEFSMKVICERLGIKNYITSDIDTKTGEIRHFNIRHNKIKAFFELYPDAEIDEFYTDSPVNDQPLIDLAKSAFVVKGDKITKIK